MLAFKCRSDFISIWCSLEEVRPFEALSPVSFHHISRWAVSFLCPVFAVGLIVPHLIRDHRGSQAPFTAESIVLIFDLGDSKREITLSGLPTQVCSKREMLIYFLMCLGTSVAQSVCWQTWGEVLWERPVEQEPSNAEHAAKGSRRGEGWDRMGHRGKKD